MFIRATELHSNPSFGRKLNSNVKQASKETIYLGH